MAMALFDSAGAGFSVCRRYRYTLWREWGPERWCNFVMLNPSTADAEVDDPTVERCMRRARQLGCGGLFVTNAFALRSTDPKALYADPDPVGAENDSIIVKTAQMAALVIVGWGEHCDKVRPGRSDEVLRLIRAAGAVPHALQVNASGAPKHPLYIGYAAQPQPYGATP